MEHLAEMVQQIIPALQDQANGQNSSAESDGADSEFFAALKRIGIRKRFYQAKIDRVPKECHAQFKTYVDEIAENISGGMGLILSGPKGVGKTSMLSIIAKAALYNGKSDIMFLDAYLLAKILVSDEYENQHLIKGIGNCKLLLIDDLGTEYGHEWPMSAINHLFNKRYGDMLATCASTNISMSRFERNEPDTAKYARIFDRWMDSTAYTFLEINAESQRR